MSLGMYGDGGSMKGSGIDSESYSGWFYCSMCDKEFELDGSTDDWGNTAFAECPRCMTQLEKDIADERRGFDEDSAYDSWVESQIELGE